MAVSLHSNTRPRRIANSSPQSGLAQVVEIALFQRLILQGHPFLLCFQSETRANPHDFQVVRRRSAPSPTWRTFLRNLVERHRCDQHVRRGVRFVSVALRDDYSGPRSQEDRTHSRHRASDRSPGSSSAWSIRFAASVWIISSCSTSAIWLVSCPYRSTTTNARARIFPSIRIVPSGARSCPQGRKRWSVS